MIRNNLLALDSVTWATIDGDDLEIGFIPSAGVESAGLLFNPTDARVIKRICTNLFVDFKGYYDDGAEEIPNGLDMRIELFSKFPPVRTAIALGVDKAMQEVTKGEG